MPAREIQFVTVIGCTVLKPPRGADGHTCEAIYCATAGLGMRRWWVLLTKERGRKWGREMDVGGCVRHASLLSISRKCWTEVDGKCAFLFWGCIFEWKPSCFNLLLCIYWFDTVWALQTMMLLLYFDWTKDLKYWLVMWRFANIQLKLCVRGWESVCVWAVSHLSYHCQGPGTSSVCLAEAAPTQQHVGGVTQQNKQHPHPVPRLTPCLSPLT